MRQVREVVALDESGIVVNLGVILNHRAGNAVLLQERDPVSGRPGLRDLLDDRNQLRTVAVAYVDRREPSLLGKILQSHGSTEGGPVAARRCRDLGRGVRAPEGVGM